MSKSKGNVVAPDEIVAAHGADALRLHTLFMGPPEADKEWTDSGVSGPARFVRTAYRVVSEIAERTLGRPAARLRRRRPGRRPGPGRSTARSRASATTSTAACTSTPPSPPAWSC